MANETPLMLPELGEGVYEAELVRWLVQPGDVVKHGQSLVEVLTDKATMEVPSSFVGTVLMLHAQAGEQVKVGAKILTFDGEKLGVPDGESTPEAVGAVPTTRVNGTPVVSTVQAKAAPSVRHMARKLGIDLGQVRGSGPGGRVLIDDLTRHLQPARTASRSDAPKTPSLDIGKAGTRIELKGLRRKIAEKMVESKTIIPHYTYVDEVDITALVKQRALALEHFSNNGVKLTYLPFFVRATARALREIPIANATFDAETSSFTLHTGCHIGIAVATPTGLIVPVIRDADKKEIWQIARDIDRLSSDARAGKSQREDLTGGTFTITSIGGIGGLISTPIINYPEVGILGLGKVVKRPVFDDAGAVKPADVIYISLSFDHRIVDGAVGALFGNALVKQLQNPASLLLPERMS